MRVRTATAHDTDTVVKLLRNYSEFSPVVALRTNQNEQYIRTLITHLLAGMGAIWLAEDSDGTPAGMIVACRVPNVWNPTVITVNEMAFWVEPWARNTTVGYRLLKAYEDYAEQQTDTVGYTVSRLNTSEFDPARRGYSMIEQTYIKQ